MSCSSWSQQTDWRSGAEMKSSDLGQSISSRDMGPQKISNWFQCPCVNAFHCKRWSNHNLFVVVLRKSKPPSVVTTKKSVTSESSCRTLVLHRWRRWQLRFLPLKVQGKGRRKKRSDWQFPLSVFGLSLVSHLYWYRIFEDTRQRHPPKTADSGENHSDWDLLILQSHESSHCSLTEINCHILKQSLKSNAAQISCKLIRYQFNNSAAVTG